MAKTIVPTDSQLMKMPKARAAEYELSDKETKTLRTRLYAINKDGICRFRIFRDGNILVVWRFK
jgi:hypothetical protein